MPEPGENETREQFMERCIPMVMEEGREQDQAVAMCSAMFEKKNVELGADPVIFFGGEVKSLDNGHFGGYLVRFSDDATPDLTGDFFTKDTNFSIEPGTKTPVYFNHRLPLPVRNGGEIVIKRKIGEAVMDVDDAGVLVDAILYNRDEYEKAISMMAQKGVLGWSSGTAQHLVDREPVGKSYRITSWPLGLDASMTPTPAEPKNYVIPLKSLSELFPQIPQLPDLPEPEGEAEGAGDAPQSDGEGEPVVEGTAIKSITDISESVTMEITEEKLRELLDDAAVKAANSIIEKLPTTNAAGINQVEVKKDEADQPWENPGQFFMAVKTAELTRYEDPRLRSLKAPTGLSEQVPSDGGYLVTSAVAPGLIERVYGGGEIASRVAKDQVGPNSNGMTYNAIDETSRIDGSRWGGLRAYWTAEAGTKTASDPTFRKIDLKLKKLVVLSYATDELLQDATALQGWLTRTVPQEILFLVEDGIINGSGVGTPLGIMNNAALVTVTRHTATTIKFQDIANMWARRFPGVSDYVWLINQDAVGELWQMTAGSYTAAFLPPGGLTGAQYGTILGKPVIETEHCQSLNTKGDIMLASLSQYQAIEKGGVQSASSIHVKFTTDETAFRFVYRYDGAPTWYSALTPAHGSNTQSPFVVLGSASA